MKVTLRLFAGLRDLLGERAICIELPDGATVADLRAHLSRRYPAIEPLLPTAACAIREEFVPHGHRLHDGDDVAIIPPVSGGAGDDCFHVTAEPLDPEELLRAVRKDESGAVLLFFGVARNHSDGRRVLALEYEAYPEMAERKLREVAAEVRARWPVTGIGALHRTGRLAIGETSLLVAVSSAHRQAAFEACQYAVDRIKQVVPVWKKEIWEDGEGAWVAGHPVDVPEQIDNKTAG